MTNGAFCSDCFAEAKRIIFPCCEKCGVSLPGEAFGGTQKTCVSCQLRPPAWRSARAAFEYDDWSRRLILPMKYADRMFRSTGCVTKARVLIVVTRLAS